MIEKDQQPREDDQPGGTSKTKEYRLSDDEPGLLVRPEVRQGQFPGNERVRFVLPRKPALRRVRRGVLEATAVSQTPTNAWGRVKRMLIGSPIPTSRSEHERLTKVKALAVLSSDVISSVAYATEAILATLIVAGSVNLGLTLPISIAIVLLLAIVALSYRQTIPAYPNGGGSYIVAKDNLGTLPGLVAAASLMIDYILTVSVSVSAGVQALATLFPALSSTFTIVSIDVALVLFIMLVNLRGVRESGSIFAVPTYVFIGSALLLIIVGALKSFFVQHNPVIGHFQYVAATEPLSIFLILRSFAAGCAALTGTEAISNGIPAFKKPEARNAATTLTWMVVILGTLFIGTTVLAMSYHIEAIPSGNPTVIGQIAQQVFTGPLFFMYPVFQIATLLILTLAANTSFADFPRLASLLARDHFLPHQFAFRGDRLAFSIGIVFLAVLASLLLVVFKGDTTSLINLYAVGVFMSFTLSQGGMVRHWWRLRREKRGWQRSMAINGLGALTTLLVALVIATTKFLSGAWIVVILIPLLVLMFLAIHRHYLHVERERTTEIPIRPKDIHHRFIVPVERLDLAAKRSLSYARSITPRVTAVHVALDRQKTDALRTAWEEEQSALSEDERAPLEIIEPERHSLVHSLLHYIDAMKQQYPDETLTVVLPEFAEGSFLKRLLRNPIILRLKISLFFRPEIVVTNLTLPEQNNTLPLRPKDVHHRVIVPVAELDRVSLQSLAYARSISHHVTAAHVAMDEQEVEMVQSKWERLQNRLSQEEETYLVVVESPYRSLLRPLLAYIDTVHALYPEDTLTVILPEFVVAHWWEFFLHNQTAFQLKTALLARSDIVVTDIPQHLRSQTKEEEHINDAQT
ncbi:MAG TPA: APC family permease [Ktedonobacteraceae bacterium]